MLGPNIPLPAMIIIILTGFFSIYAFYLVSVYIKLENRRSLILSKFTAVNELIDEKIEFVKELNDILKDEEIEKVRNKLVSNSNVNDRIRYNKKIDKLLKEVSTDKRKTKKIIEEINDVNERLDYSKEFYNASLEDYNNILTTKSGKILKKILKYTKYNTF